MSDHVSKMITRFQGDRGTELLRSELAKQPVVKHDEDVARRLVDAGSLRVFADGDALIVQGEAKNSIFFLVAGQVEVHIEGRFVGRKTARQHVGEMAALDPAAPRSATVTATEETVALEVSEEGLAGIAEERPDVWRAIAVELASTLRERTAAFRIRNSRPYVFIGSSAELLGIAEAIQKKLEHLDAVVSVWSDDVFRPSNHTMEDLQEECDKSDFAVLVVGAEDVVESREKKKPAPRDNVIFELGLFMGALGRERTVFVVDRTAGTKIPSDLLGIKPIKYEVKDPKKILAAIGPVATEIKALIERLGPR